MKKVVSIVFILLLFFGSSYASFKDSLKQYLEKNNIVLWAKNQLDQGCN